MKKIIVFICLVLFLLPSHVISAQCDDELQGWIDLFRKDEKNSLIVWAMETYFLINIYLAIKINFKDASR